MRARGVREGLDLVLVVIASAWTLHRSREGAAFTVDDAYIVVRYAENLVHHGRLAFNLDGAPVEGFTSVLGVAVAALGALVGPSPLAWLKGAGVLAALAQPFLVRRVGRALGASTPAAGLTALTCAALAEHGLHAPSGLETELFVALGLALLASAARATRGGSALVPAVLAALLVLTRPEGLVPAVAALAFVAHRKRALRAVTLGFVVPLAVVETARVAWFHAFVPNTFHVKTGELAARVPLEVGGLLVDVGAAAAVVALAATLVARVHGIRAARPPRGTLAAVLVVAALAAGYARVVPIMDYGRRFAFHALPWMAVLTLAAFHVAVTTADRLGRRRIAGLAPVVLVALAAFTGVARGAAHDRVVALRRERAAAGLAALYLPATVWLGEHLAPGAKLAVYPDAGLVPLATGLATIDFGRLNDAYLARHARTGADVATYFFDRDPDALVLASPAPGQPFDDGAAAIMQDARFRERYVLAKRFDYGRVGLEIYARRP